MDGRWAIDGLPRQAGEGYLRGGGEASDLAGFRLVRFAEFRLGALRAVGHGLPSDLVREQDAPTSRRLEASARTRRRHAVDLG
jgi:hypothetical protein